MNKKYVFAFLIVGALSSQAQAACNVIQVTDMQGTLGDKLVCAHKGNPSNPNERWSEVHDGAGLTGDLIEWGRGPSDVVNKSHTIGTWTIDDSADTVSYSYTDDGGSPYVYYLYDDGLGQYSYCDTDDGLGTVQATVKVIVGSPAGANPCAW